MAERLRVIGDPLDLLADPDVVWDERTAFDICMRAYAVIPGHLPLASQAGATIVIDTVMTHAENIVAILRTPILRTHYERAFRANMSRCRLCEALTVTVDGRPSLYADPRVRCGACGSRDLHTAGTRAGGLPAAKR
jgi:hypothetical protein